MLKKIYLMTFLFIPVCMLFFVCQLLNLFHKILFFKIQILWPPCPKVSNLFLILIYNEVIYIYMSCISYHDLLDIVLLLTRNLNKPRVPKWWRWRICLLFWSIRFTPVFGGIRVAYSLVFFYVSLCLNIVFFFFFVTMVL